MHLKCTQVGLVVSQRTVHYLLMTLDPQGVYLRLQKRQRQRLYRNLHPNVLWPVDSEDKLKAYERLRTVPLMGFHVWSYGYILTPQIAIPGLLLVTSLMKWKTGAALPHESGQIWVRRTVQGQITTKSSFLTQVIIAKELNKDHFPGNSFTII